MLLSDLIHRIVASAYEGLLPPSTDGSVGAPDPQRLLAVHLLTARQRLLRLYTATQWALQQGRGVQAVTGSAIAPLDSQDRACRDAHSRLHALQESGLRFLCRILTREPIPC